MPDSLSFPAGRRSFSLTKKSPSLFQGREGTGVSSGGAEFSILLKDSAVCYVLGTQDIMARTAAVAARTHEALALYAAAGVIYFVLTIIVLKLLHRLEVKVQIPGYSGDNNFSGNGAAA